MADDSPFPGDDHRPFAFGGERAESGALLLHGFMGTPKEMRPLGRALAEAGVAVRGPLLPGFGPDVAALDRTRAEDWLRAAGSAWDEVAGRHDRAVLIGFSMGGALALRLAARRPPARLVLLAPYTRLPDRRAAALPLARHVVKEIRPFAGRDFADPGVRQYFAARDPSLDLDDPATRARLVRDTTISTAVLDELRRACAGGRRAAPRAVAPTLVLQGTADGTSRPADTRRLLARLGGMVQYHELPADHLLVADDRPAWPRVRDLVVAFAMGEAAPAPAPVAAEGGRP